MDVDWLTIIILVNRKFKTSGIQFLRENFHAKKRLNASGQLSPVSVKKFVFQFCFKNERMNAYRENRPIPTFIQYLCIALKSAFMILFYSLVTFFILWIVVEDERYANLRGYIKLRYGNERLVVMSGLWVTLCYPLLTLLQLFCVFISQNLNQVLIG